MMSLPLHSDRNRSMSSSSPTMFSALNTLVTSWGARCFKRYKERKLRKEIREGKRKATLEDSPSLGLDGHGGLEGQQFTAATSGPENCGRKTARSDLGVGFGVDGVDHEMRFIGRHGQTDGTRYLHCACSSRRISTPVTAMATNTSVGAPQSSQPYSSRFSTAMAKNGESSRSCRESSGSTSTCGSGCRNRNSLDFASSPVPIKPLPQIVVSSPPSASQGSREEAGVILKPGSLSAGRAGGSRSGVGSPSDRLMVRGKVRKRLALPYISELNKD